MGAAPAGSADAGAERAQAGPWNLYSPRQRALFLATLFLVGLSSYVDKNLVGVLIEPIKAEFGASDTMLGLLSGISFALLYATLGIPVARWADRGDRRFIITLSLTIWSGATALCGFAHSFWQLLAARFGVGAGEAGAIPPAQSLIADYFPPWQRTRAISIFLLSSSAGYAVGLMLGGYLAYHHGWRFAFIVVGCAGVVLAPLARFILREPRLLHAPVRADSPAAESMAAALRHLFRKPSYRAILVAMVLYFLWSYGVLVFVVSLLMRTQALDVADAGALFGLVSAGGALAGTLSGGILADRLVLRDPAWLARLSGYGLFLTFPAYELALGSSILPVMTVFLVVGTFLLSASLPSAYSAIYHVCGAQRRALAVAILFFFANLIGLGLGPVLTGALSDFLGATLGSGEGLRRAMMIMTLALIPAGLLMFRAARALGADAEA